MLPWDVASLCNLDLTASVTPCTEHHEIRIMRTPTHQLHMKYCSLMYFAAAISAAICSGFAVQYSQSV